MRADKDALTGRNDGVGDDNVSAEKREESGEFGVRSSGVKRLLVAGD